jgi:hypothetical protein
MSELLNAVCNDPCDLVFSASRASDATRYHLKLVENKGLPVTISSGPRAAFADLVLGEMIETPTDVARITRMLGMAIKACDAAATKSLWNLLCKSTDIDTDDFLSPKLDTKANPISPDVFEFLIFYVREPCLVLLLWIQQTGDKKTARECLEPAQRNKVVPMVASVMIAVNASTSPLQRPAESERRALWSRLLDMLYAVLPSWPVPLWIRNRDLQAGTVSLLQVAVACSKHAPLPVHRVVSWCGFSSTSLSNAFADALRPGTLGDDTILPVVRAVYQCHLDAVRPMYETNAESARERAWTRVLSSASGWKEVSACHTPSGTLRVPDYKGAERKDAWHPDVYDEILYTMVQIHVEKQKRDGKSQASCVCSLACKALPIVLGQRNQTHLVERLVMLVIQNGKTETLLNIKDFLWNVCCLHVSLYPLIEPHFAIEEHDARKVDPSKRALLVDAMVHCIYSGRREGVKLLMGTLKTLPMTHDRVHLLLHYVESMSATNTWATDCGFNAEMMREHYAAVKRDFQAFMCMATADAWTNGELCAALNTASLHESAIAVEVLVSPPYNTPMPGDDPFVAQILEGVLAPNAPMVRALGDDFKKRQRCE